MFFWCAHLGDGVGFFSYLRGAMKNRFVIVFLLLFTSLSLCAQGIYHPGDVVPEPYLKVFGYEHFFRIKPVSDDIQALMKAFSSKDGIFPIEDLRYLRVLHRDKDGDAIVGEMVCAKSIADDLLEIFRELYLASYPIERMRLVDYYGGDDEASMQDNNSSCFNYRPITAGGRTSKHGFGLAVDINPKYNPYYKVKESGRTIVRPEGSEEYLDRNAVFPYKIMKGDLCYRLFRQHGFQWGGDWASGKDYQHFEKLMLSAPKPQSDSCSLPAGRRR